MLSQADIQAAADRIASALKPKKIILFGSYARGNADDSSDLDLLIVAPDGMTEWDAMTKGRLAVGRVKPGTGVDILAYTEENFRERQDWCSSALYWAVREGKVLYEA